MKLGRLVSYIWAAPTSAVALPFVLLGAAGIGTVKLVDGVIEIHGGPASFFLRRCTLLPGGASAMTLGHVVIGRNQRCLDSSRAHERIHVRQVERWGPLFLPAYLVASGIAWARGRHAYHDNPFEREAYAADRARLGRNT